MASSSTSTDQELVDFIFNTYEKIAKKHAKLNGYIFHDVNKHGMRFRNSNNMFNELNKHGLIVPDSRMMMRFEKGVLSCKENALQFKSFKDLLTRQIEKSWDRLISKFDNGVLTITVRKVFIMDVIFNDDGSETFDIFEAITETEENRQKVKQIIDFCDFKEEVQKRYHPKLVEAIDKHTIKNQKQHDGLDIAIYGHNRTIRAHECSFNRGIIHSIPDCVHDSNGTLLPDEIDKWMEYMAEAFICSMLRNSGDNFFVVRSEIEVTADDDYQTFVFTTNHFVNSFPKQREDQQEEKGCEKKE